MYQPFYSGDGAEDQDTGEEGGEPVAGEPLREQDRFLPIANVARIMKKSIPNTGKVNLLLFHDYAFLPQT